MTTTLRPEGLPDEAFLRRLILDTIAGELGASAWPEPMRTHLLDMQYLARRHSRGAGLPETSSQIIQADGADAGWLVTTDLPHEVRLVEIMVLPERRGQGVGTTAIRQLLAGATAARKPVRLSVNVTNRAAIALYERLGFRRIDGDEVQHVMECCPPS
jgi:ribosomal protein S18 acetylase RimI-like enzyme